MFSVDFLLNPCVPSVFHLKLWSFLVTRFQIPSTAPINEIFQDRKFLPCCYSEIVMTLFCPFPLCQTQLRFKLCKCKFQKLCFLHLFNNNTLKFCGLELSSRPISVDLYSIYTSPCNLQLPSMSSGVAVVERKSTNWRRPNQLRRLSRSNQHGPVRRREVRSWIASQCF